VEPARKQETTAIVHGDEITLQTGSSADTSANDEVAHNNLRPVTFTPTAYTRWVKPASDRIAALIALTVFAIPMLSIALVVCYSMGRPVFFRQRRIGLNGRVFEVLKFRTMGHDRRHAAIRVIRDHRLTHKSDEDPRHTTVGRFLRQFSLDELPQLLNIVRGDMSIVGPRPELESVVAEHYSELLHQRHLVKPGLTGLWQISARGSGAMHENGEWDLEYVEKVSLLTDIAIVCKTPFAMFGRNQGH
jgi:lipopolysaccharide/colanic/teichoic acid biosynthesis glycosyltransferase